MSDEKGYHWKAYGNIVPQASNCTQRLGLAELLEDRRAYLLKSNPSAAIDVLFS